VAFDNELAGRIRELLAGERGVSEKRMFGGLAFLVRGNMAIAASGQGGALVRCDSNETHALVARTNAEAMVMRCREMHGWLRVAAEHLGTKRQLAKWVAIGAAYAKTLPPK
jgi:TfoX/Sxy family transcriptional regulator of competence genes